MNDFEDKLNELTGEEFERELGRLLKGREAPEGFSDGVMRRLTTRDRRPGSRWRMAIAAGLLVCVAGAGYDGYERHEAAEARAQFAVAMRVTNRSLKAVDEGLSRIRTNEGELR